MSIAAVLYILSIVLGSATLGILVDRRINRREPIALPIIQSTHLLSAVSTDDAQWLQVFRETVLASEGRISPFLDGLLSQSMAQQTESEVAEILAKARKDAEIERSRLLTEANAEAANIRQLAVKSRLEDSVNKCAYCSVRSDPRCKGGNCGRHCTQYCPCGCRA